MNTKVVCLWSGGKDCCIAYYKAKAQGYDVVSFFNFTNSGGKDSLSHGVSAEIILKQTEKTGIFCFQKAMPQKSYEQEFKHLISEWKQKRNIEGIVFGDIYLQEHKDWIDRVCKELEVTPLMPLWGKDTKDLIEEFIKIGFKAIVVSTQADILGKEWLGRKIDNKFIKDLMSRGNVDFCGEKGEFHSFVYDGPIFKEPLRFSLGKKIFKDKHWFLELIPENT